MEKYEKDNLIDEVASKVHNDWCIQELKDYFGRLQNTIKNSETPGLALGAACYDGVQKRNEVDVLYSAYMSSFDATFQNAVKSGNFEEFCHFIYDGYFEIKRFAKRSLTDKEISKVGNNYRNGEENILRPYKELSVDSKKWYLDVAKGVFDVYEELCWSGIYYAYEINKSNIGGFIKYVKGNEWLSEHKNSIEVFEFLKSVIKQNGDNYLIDSVEDYELTGCSNTELDGSDEMITSVCKKKSIY